MKKQAFLLGCSLLFATAPRLSSQERGAVALSELTQGLGTTTRVLMIGAHPDDEDTQMIAYLAKAKHIETAYLSLTRGDGGQNLIGNELGEALGVIRTEELLAARRIDGGRQYFTRAFDFGFSKNIEETYRHWPKDSILKDMVAIVRAYRPHVIISVWSGTPADGHGHHQYAGVLARDVFDAAADSVHFPAAAVGGLPAWAPAKFYRVRRGGRDGVAFNVGEVDQLTGESYAQIAAVSRSQHRSQGQGTSAELGPRYTGLRLEASRVSGLAAESKDLFAGMDSSLKRFANLPLLAPVRASIDSLVQAQAEISALNTRPRYDPWAKYLRLVTRAADGLDCVTEQPATSGRPACAGAKGDLALVLASLRDRATRGLLLASGVVVQATVPREVVAEHDSVPVTISVYNQGEAPVTLVSAAVQGRERKPSANLMPDSSTRVTLSFPAAGEPTMAWWLRRPRDGDMFDQRVPGQPRLLAPEMLNGEDRLESTRADVVVRIAGLDVPVRVAPIVYRFTNPALGEVRLPLAVAPEITVRLEHQVEYARANSVFDRTVLVAVHSFATAARTVDVSLDLPAGLHADTATRHVTLPPDGEGNLYFRVQGRLSPGRFQVAAKATSGGQSYSLGFVPIEYDHIRPQRYYRPAVVQIEAVNAAYANLRIGYIRGVGDNVLPMLRELGLPATELDPAALPQTDLSAFSTIVLGTRAYEASHALVANNAVLMDFARKGGTIVTQYGQFEYEKPGILPYSITMTRPADRVTDEFAAVKVLDANASVLSAPNRVSDADFANWVQERSSYMPRTFDPHYHTVLSMHDPGEPANDAAILVAPLGKGTYVYTTLSFFRQLPAGNPGAARLFINLLSAGRTGGIQP